RGFRDHIAGVRADDVDAQHAVGFGIGENFDEAFGLLIGLGTSVGGERKLSDLVSNAGGFQFFLGFADRCDLRISVDHVRDRVIVYVTGLTGENFGDGDSLVLGLVCEHRSRDHVADGIDAGYVGRVAVVDLNAAAIVERNTDLLQAETVDVRHPADRDQHDISFDSFGSAPGRRLDSRLELAARAVDRSDLGRQAERHALLFENALKLPRDFSIHAGQNAIQKLDHVHLRTEPPPNRAELEPDDAGADDQQALRHLAQHQRPGRRHNALLVDDDALEPRDVGSAGDDDVLGLHRLGLAVRGFDLNPARRCDAGDAGKRVDLVFLEQERDALDVAIDAFVLELHHGGEVEL